MGDCHIQALVVKELDPLHDIAMHEGKASRVDSSSRSLDGHADSSNIGADGGFYDARASGFVYSPVLGQAIDVAIPSAEKSLAFTVILSGLDMSSFFAVGAFGFSPEQQFVFSLNSFLKANVNRLAYCELVSATSGSVSANTDVHVPYTLGDAVSTSAATSAISTLETSLRSASTLAAVWDPNTFGTSMAAGFSAQGAKLCVAQAFVDCHWHEPWSGMQTAR